MAKNTCRNGHSANSAGNCFVAGCPDEHKPSNQHVTPNRPACPPIPQDDTE